MIKLESCGKNIIYSQFRWQCIWRQTELKWKLQNMPEKSYSLQIVTSYTARYKFGTEEKQNLMDPWTQSPLCNATMFTNGLIFDILLSSLLLPCLILNWSLTQYGGCAHRYLRTCGTWEDLVPRWAVVWPGQDACLSFCDNHFAFV